MTMPDLQATSFQPEDAAEAPAFPRASTPGYDEAVAISGVTTYGTACDMSVADPYAQQGYGVPDPDTNAQGTYGAEAYGQPGYEQAVYAVGQQACSQPVYGQPVYGQSFAAGVLKRWIVALLLAFLLGALGIHNLYLGYATKGIIQLILAITTIGAPIAAVRVFTEFIVIIARSGSYVYDAQGQSLQ